MTSTLSSQEISEAMESCAAEPIHIPGIVQPFGCLLAADKHTMVVKYASANTERFLGVPYQELLGGDLDKILTDEIWHELNNAQSQDDLVNASTIVGDFRLGDQLLTMHASERDGMFLLEFEQALEAEFSGPNMLKTINFLTSKIESCESEDTLFDLSTRLLRHLTDFDRVMIYRFDSAFNGEVLKEDRNRSMPGFEGLRFPHWDIPPQARAMMELIPLRFIVDAKQEPVPLKALHTGAAPLDISLCTTRGVSSVHMEYLHNMQVASTMTLTIKVGDALWGILSFHHRTPKLVSGHMRSLLVNVARMFSSKLQVLQQKTYLSMVSQVDGYKDQILDSVGSDAEFEKFGGMVLDILDACGLVVIQSDQERVYGTVPDKLVRAAIEGSLENGTDFVEFGGLATSFPDLREKLNGCAGALVFSPAYDRTLFVFRKEVEREVAWAGNPDKHAATHEGRLRLSPRGSFATYLESVKDMSKPWSDQDYYFVKRFWTLINSLDRNELISSLNRQQKIMIDELNHRVRNILALVRSVSQQAQSSSYGSLDSYSRSLESRIEALAASHDLASGSMTTAVPVTELVKREFEPYLSEKAGQLIVSGQGRDIRPDIAPIFSLVIHELVTNAVKYGALSSDDGVVKVGFQNGADGLILSWGETGGPAVIAPEIFGFGSTLIKEAIPFELNGEAELNFESSGVTARFRLPESCFEVGEAKIEPSIRAALPSISDKRFREVAKSASCLLVEDNFVIALSTRDQLQEFGIETVEVAASVDTAEEYLRAFTPSFAILDISLGKGKTSISLAEALKQKQIPFIFVSGFGDRHQLPSKLQDVVKLTKPVSSTDLKNAVGGLLLKQLGAAL